MAYVIGQNCCKDASCISVCPVNCIGLSTNEFHGAQAMLYIDPDVCIDCGACAEECPVDAIYPEDDLPESQQPFKQINAIQMPLTPYDSEANDVVVSGGRTAPLRVAIVGTGPSACYAVEALVDTGTEVNVFERLTTPFGLVRAGVAPDHQRTKRIVDRFSQALSAPGVRCHFNLDIGRDITHDELLAHHHAVIYAVGAPVGRELDIPGARLTGVDAAIDFVAWYNGHPDHVTNTYELSGERAIVVGNGNVAIDVARILLMDRDALALTDIAEPALAALLDSNIREVVIFARRDFRAAAFSIGEFLALGNLDGVDVEIHGDDLAAVEGDTASVTLALDAARAYTQRPPTHGNKRIVFRFGMTPVRVVGDVSASGLVVTPTGGRGTEELIESPLILCAIGSKVAPGLPLPIDEQGAIRNDRGRVVDDATTVMSGLYVTGWAKRGPSGVIGSNRTCAAETVRAVIDDREDLLARQLLPTGELQNMLDERGLQALTWSQWSLVDAAEVACGTQKGVPRVKFTHVEDVLSIIG
ncbi:4Fe-4S binding protein [Rhodococcus sp. NPDC057014]|uniref:4Fe-4S binding protein n=1 Tax=Rhodococcus sp. NPDC057014 TaxID=3346000 RepID=UPI00362DB12F